MSTASEITLEDYALVFDAIHTVKKIQKRRGINMSQKTVLKFIVIF